MHKTPRVGNLPKPNCTNPLLNKAEVGKVRKPPYSLPDKNFAYGAVAERDNIGAGDMIRSWMEHQGTKNKQPGKDYKSLNRMCVTNQCSSAKDFANFRKTHDARLKNKAEMGISKAQLPSDENPQFAYGSKTQASEDIGQVLNNQYQYVWVRGQLQKGGDSTMQKEMMRKRQVAPTRASLGHQAGGIAMKKKGDDAPKEEFKMRKFKDIEPKLRLPGPRSRSRSPH